MLKSSMCKQRDIESPEFQKWISYWFPPEERLIMTRKSWEWAYICQALFERNKLQKGNRGVGFAVGKEPLTTIFVHHDCEILATDMPCDTTVAEVWDGGNQHSSFLDDVYCGDYCQRQKFNELASFRPVDMNFIPANLGSFDFMWSSCSLEHLGDMQKGIDFIFNSLKYLKRGGVAIFTTEYNIQSNEDTITEGDSVIYRKRDIEEFSKKLTDSGEFNIDLDFSLGEKEYDLHVDTYPYKNPHLRLLLLGYVSTSIGVIIERK